MLDDTGKEEVCFPILFNNNNPREGFFNFFNRMFIALKKMFSGSVGSRGENVACEFLKKNGYAILGRNYKNKLGRQLGEIDIIACDQEEIVFCEVKTRQSLSPSSANPEENINAKKLRKLQKIANLYIKEHRLWDKNFRFDAIAVCLSAQGKIVKINHIKSIFI